MGRPDGKIFGLRSCRTDRAQQGLYKWHIPPYLTQSLSIFDLFIIWLFLYYIFWHMHGSRSGYRIFRTTLLMSLFQKVFLRVHRGPNTGHMIICTYWLSRKARQENIGLNVNSYGPSAVSQIFSCLAQPNSFNKHFIICPGFSVIKSTKKLWSTNRNIGCGQQGDIGFYSLLQHSHLALITSLFPKDLLRMHKQGNMGHLEGARKDLT